MTGIAGVARAAALTVVGAVTLLGPITPAAAQDAEPSDTLPRYLQPFYERVETREGTGDGIFMTRDELMAMDVNTVGAAIRLRARRAFRTRGTGESCRPEVYWNGIPLDQLWSPRSGIADTPIDVMEGVEIYYADWMDLPLEYQDAECGVISLWARPGAEDRGTTDILVRLGIVMALGLVFFLTVGS